MSGPNKEVELPSVTAPTFDESESENSGSPRGADRACDEKNRFVGKYSSADWHRDGDEVNEEMLYKSVMKAGMWAYGVSVVEVWTWNKEEHALYRPAGGYWRDPVFDPSEALLRIEDKTRDDYVPPHPLGPGEGLAGVLWSETRNPQTLRGVLHNTFLKKPVNKNARSDERDVENNLGQINENTPDHSGFDPSTGFGKVAWRYVNALAEDPDQPPNERLKLLGEAGFGLAAGVLFNVRGFRGIVVYMARSTVNINRLQTPTNEAYMRNAADLIGAESALSVTRKASIEQRAEERHLATRKMKRKLQTLAVAIGAGAKAKETTEKEPTEKEPTKEGSAVQDSSKAVGKEGKDAGHADPAELAHDVTCTTKLLAWVKKSKGKGVRPPPPLPLPRVGWTFISCFISMAVVMNVIKAISRATGGKYAMPAPVYAAITCLNYGLTAAPAGQPRNMMLGQFVSTSLTVIVGYILNDRVTAWVHLSIVVALVVSTMVWMGLVHPPAAALSVIFASGKKGWGHVGFALVVDSVAIALSIMLNNASSKRQYPIYWGWFDFHMGWNEPTAKKGEKESEKTKQP